MDAREMAARAICVSCGENPDHRGDARGNDKRWQDYLDCADAAIFALSGDGVLARLDRPEGYETLTPNADGFVSIDAIVAALEAEPGGKAAMDAERIVILRSEIEFLRGKIKRTENDAERYRWWRSKQRGWSPYMDGTFAFTAGHLPLRGRSFDEAVDAAMASDA